MSSHYSRVLGGRRVATIAFLSVALALVGLFGGRTGPEEASAATIGTALSCPANVTGGATITCTVAADLAGPGLTSVTFPAIYTANLPACDGGGVAGAAGSVATCTYAAGGADRDMTASAVAPVQANCTGDIAGTVTANASDTGAPASDTEAISLETPCLTIDKEDVACPPAVGIGDPVNAGGTVCFDFDIINSNNGQAAGSVVMTDQFPSQFNPVSVTSSPGGLCSISGQTLTCNIGTIANNSSVDVDVVAGVRTNITTGTVVINTMNVTASNISGTLQNNEQTVILSTSSMEVTKTASQNPISTLPPDTFTWTITATNTGTSPLTNVVIYDNFTNIDDIFLFYDPVIQVSGFGPISCVNFVLVGFCNVGTLPAGSSVTMSVSVTPIVPLPDGYIAENIGGAFSDETGDVPTAGTVVVKNDPNLRLVKISSGLVGHAAGGPVGSYLIRIDNGGLGAANVNILDVVPPGLTRVGGSCPGGAVVNANITVPGGGTAQCTIDVVLTAGTTPASGTPFLNTVTLTDLAAGGDTLTASAILAAAVPTLELVKTSSGTTDANSGSFTLTLTNTGNATATGVTLVDAVDPRLNVVSNTCGNPGTLAANASYSCTIQVRPGANTVDGEVVGNSATADSAETAEVVDDADIMVQKGMFSLSKSNTPAQVGPGGVVTSTIVVSNTGSDDIDSVYVQDYLPGDASFVANGSSAQCSQPAWWGPQYVECYLGTLSPGETVTLTIKWLAPSTLGNGYACNQANTYNGSNVANVTTSSCVDLVSASGYLRHVDVDPGQENAAGNSYGVLPQQDDEDDAIGSLHTVCLFSGNLGAAENNDIVWSITKTANSDATVSPAPAGTKTVMNLPGDSQANCVQWRSGGTGGQDITATYTVTGATFYWSGQAPAIKEWNDIHVTNLVAATGRVGASYISQNTSSTDVSDWTDSDSRDTTFWLRADQSGNVVSVTGTLVTAGSNAGYVYIPASSLKTYIDYVLGSHADYAGPIDGAKQTYTLSGDCGSFRIEDSQAFDDTDVVTAKGGSYVTLSSDKGIAFTILPTGDGQDPSGPNDADLECRPGDRTTVTITTTEDVNLNSPVQSAPIETITIIWNIGTPANKQPILAWAGQRVVLEHDWAQAGTCPVDGWAYASYRKQAQGPGGFAANYDDNWDWAPDDVVVRYYSPSTNCVSRAMYESQDPGEVDISAWLVDWYSNGHYIATSEEVDFLIYFMKLESVTTTIVPGTRRYHNAGSFTGSPFDLTKDVTAQSSNVSADVLVRVRVKGWFTAVNATGRAAAVDSNGGALPAGRWVMPDDWNMLAGGSLALSLRPNYDIMLTAGGSYSCASVTTCDSRDPATTLLITQDEVAGPFSLIDGPRDDDGKAPLVLGGYRDTWLPDGAINADDAPMPPSLVNIAASGAGYLKGVSKYGISTRNPYYVTHIPAEPSIPAYTADGQGYRWDTWNGDGPYCFWTCVAGQGSQVFSAGAKDDGTNSAGVVKKTVGGTDALGNLKSLTPATFTTRSNESLRGLTSVRLYTDNHGEAMVWANGDAGLSMDECSDAASKTSNGVVSLSGAYCEKGDKVGTTTISASADYPDKRKHYPLSSGSVTVTWTWGGYKKVTIQDGEAPQFKYVVIHMKDRDGFCDVPKVQATRTVAVYQNGTPSYPLNLVVSDGPDALYVRTSSSQELVSNSTEIRVLTPAAELKFAVATYAGLPVPGAVNASGTAGTWTSSANNYSATTVNTGYPYVVATGAYTLNGVLGEPVDFLMDVLTGGRIVDTSGGEEDVDILGQGAYGVPTFDTADPYNAYRTRTVFEAGECQAWIKISNSLLGVGNVLVVAYDPEGTITFDRVVDFQSSVTYTLHFRWTLVTWPGKDGIAVGDAIASIVADVTAVYGWDAAAQDWLAFFPGTTLPGVNDLLKLNNGDAYFIAIKGPSSVNLVIATNVD